jgi:hypothetical protein
MAIAVVCIKARLVVAMWSPHRLVGRTLLGGMHEGKVVLAGHLVVAPGKQALYFNRE